MKKALWLLSLSAVLAGLVYFWPQKTVVEPVAAEVSDHAPQSRPPAEHKTPAAAPQITVTEKIPEPVTASFKLLATAYAAELNTPPYSRPLNVDDEHLLQPNRYIVQTVPLEGGASAAIVLPKYRFSYPETVPVTLQVSGLQLADVSVRLQHETTAEQSDSKLMRGTTEQYSATLDADDSWNGAFEVQVSFRANGQQQVLKTGIEYYKPVATVTGVGEPYGIGSDMHIPVQIDVKQSGFYRLRANLYTDQRQPLALLTASEKLSKGEAEITLKAFKAVLRKHSGPFILGTVILEKRPATPGEQTQYGDSEKAQYPLDYFSLDQLSDEPWQADEQERQRLLFLQQMAGEQ